MRTARLIVGLAAAQLVVACASSSTPDVGLEDLALDEVAPVIIVPGSAVRVKGTSFVDVMWGATTLHLVGTTEDGPVDVRWPAEFVDFDTMTIRVDGSMLDELGGDVDFDGTARIDVVATSDGQTYSSDVIAVDLQFREQLTPTPVGIDGEGVIFVNDQIVVEGGGFLLGGDEGVTVAKLEGCFMRSAGGGCTPITPVEIPMVPVDAFDRAAAAFPFSPKVAGIQPGAFVGSVTIENQQTARPPIAAQSIDVQYELVTAQIFTVSPAAVSLGQYVFIEGGGFIGGEPGMDTEIELTGQFNRGGGNPAPAQLTLIPQFVEGRLVRYVVNTDDELGTTIDLRVDTGLFTGTATPIITYAGDRVRGQSKSVSLAIAPVKQVVYLDFRPTYVEGLRDFGLRAVDNRIRDRVFAVVNRVYAGVNLELREEPPTDFEIYAHVELVGKDPNNQGLFGYDNSPGKDNGNLRLYDRLGGVNALTQQDGYAGYGGVFVRSLLGFSQHPGDLATSVPGADPLFDDVFDPFRGDLGNDPVRGSDLGGDLDPIDDGRDCPADNRTDQIRCAVYVLGNLIGGTLAHEIGHSLGLANPFAEGFHNRGDAPNRIMDGGGDRPFVERAELAGQGPGVFCDEEYSYLRMILPVSSDPPAVDRPTCF